MHLPLAMARGARKLIEKAMSRMKLIYEAQSNRHLRPSVRNRGGTRRPAGSRFKSATKLATIDRREKPERVSTRWMKMSVSCMKSEMAETTSSAGRAKPHLNQSMTNVDTTNEKCANSECA